MREVRGRKGAARENALNIDQGEPSQHRKFPLVRPQSRLKVVYAPSLALLALCSQQTPLSLAPKIRRRRFSAFRSILFRLSFQLWSNASVGTQAGRKIDLGRASASFFRGIKIRDKWVARAGRMGASYRKSSIRAVFIHIFQSQTSLSQIKLNLQKHIALLIK